MQNQIPIKDTWAFMTAGSAQFILINTKSGHRFGFHIKAHKTKENLWYVTRYHDHLYLGSISNARFFPTKKPEEDIEQQVKTLGWFIDKLTTDPGCIPDYIFIYHLGNCAMCCRQLSDPESISRGIGPECYKKLIK